MRLGTHLSCQTSPIRGTPPVSDDLPLGQLEVLDADVRWASGALGLPEHAFYGKDGTDPRQAVLKSLETMDVAACPGSGKTTLLVAKLAILAKKWPHRTRGVCVLSHTNAARHQVEARLGSTAIGRRLLSYPHFIGTIHAFVNEFLALPWLRSRGYRIKMVDTDVSLRKRWYALPVATRRAIETNHLDRSLLSIKSVDGDVGDVRWGKGMLGRDTDTYRKIRESCLAAMAEGYFCYDEMFVWAQDLMEKMPGVVGTIRGRFPLLFIDEAQDNSEQQSLILSRIFMDGNGAVVRQRFGDENQAIFDFVGAQEAKTDPFPCDAVRKDLPNSHRFGPGIAKLADPLGLVPYGLVGQGPKIALTSGPGEARHTVFLFSNDNIGQVLDAYACLLLETFSEAELKVGTFTAVGQVHRGIDDEHRPRHVGHYWTGYDPELASREPHPRTFVQYLSAGMRSAEAVGQTYPATEKIAEAMFRLAGMVDGATGFSRQRRGYHAALEACAGDGIARRAYEELIADLVLRREALTEESWNSRWAEVVRKVATAIAGAPLGADACGFLAWPDDLAGAGSPATIRKNRDNFYRVQKDGRQVAIRVGSIHSVKGETHTATLVLETFWQDRSGRHNLELLLPWMNGRKSGSGSAGVQQQTRLKVHYVAMTRPTHLLCVAMKRSTFENDGAMNQELIQVLGDWGWQVRAL
jgi:hypothetical protein